MGNTSSRTKENSPDMTGARARGKIIDRARRKEAAQRQQGYADTRLENVDRTKDHLGSFAVWYTDTKLILAMLFALGALIAYSLAAFGGTPLAPAMNQLDGKFAFVKIRDTIAAEPKNSGNGVEWRFGLTGWCAQADVQDFGSPNKCTYKWFYNTDEYAQEIGVQVPGSIAHALSIMAFFELLSTIMAYIFPLMLFLWAVSDSHSPVIAYGVVVPAVTFGIIAVVGLCAIVFPEAAASELIAPGLGVYYTITGFVATIIASTLWYLSMGQYANERNIDGAFEKKKRGVFSKPIET